MGKNAKIGIAAAVVLVIGLIAIVTIGSLVGVLVIVVGALAIVALVQRLPDDEDDGGAPRPKKRQGGKSKLDDALEARKPGGTSGTTATPPRSGGLPTWNPTALDTWQPPSLSDDNAPPVAEAEASQWDSWDNWDDEAEAGDGTTITAEEDNPLDALDRLDDIDPIAEVERIDALEAEPFDDPLGRLDTIDPLDDFTFDEDEFDTTEPAVATESEPVKSGGFSFASAPPVINEEEIKTADDIMAASQATELELPGTEGDGGDSELARLLAKVQARLSAYE